MPAALFTAARAGGRPERAFAVGARSAGARQAPGASPRSAPPSRRTATTVKDEQEVLAHVANMIIESYAIESGMARAEKLAARGHALAGVAADIARVYTSDAADRIAHAGKQILNAIAARSDRAEALAMDLADVARHPGFDTVAARRRIGDAAIAAALSVLTGRRWLHSAPRPLQLARRRTRAPHRIAQTPAIGGRVAPHPTRRTCRTALGRHLRPHRAVRDQPDELLRPPDPRRGRRADSARVEPRRHGARRAGHGVHAALCVCRRAVRPPRRSRDAQVHPRRPACSSGAC